MPTYSEKIKPHMASLRDAVLGPSTLAMDPEIWARRPLSRGLSHGHLRSGTDTGMRNLSLSVLVMWVGVGGTKYAHVHDVSTMYFCRSTRWLLNPQKVSWGFHGMIARGSLSSIPGMFWNISHKELIRFMIVLVTMKL